VALPEAKSLPRRTCCPVTDGHRGHGTVCGQQTAEGCPVTSFDVTFHSDEIDLVTHPECPSQAREVEEAME
jgi:hypothetical protein